MIEDASALVRRAVVRPDVAIIGGGAAGITLARALRGSSLSVVLLESGKLVQDQRTEKLKHMESVGWPYPVDGSHLRFFGGTTNHWEGYCRPLDEDDFGGDGSAFTDWPVDRRMLDPYYARAGDVVEIGRDGFDLAATKRLVPDFDPLFDDDTWTTAFWRMSPPTRFGSKYRADIEHADNVEAYLGANVVNIVTSPDGKGVTALEVATLAGGHARVEPGVVVLATGGLESARMLLASRDASPAGVANRSDLVGRCFMEHPHLIGQGAVVFGAGTTVHPAYRDNVVDRGVALGKTRVVAGTTMTPAARREAGTLGCIVTWFAPLGPWEKSTEAQLRGVRTMLGGRQGIESTTFLNLGIRAEQHPKRDSRVLLTDKRDALGVPVAALDWKLADDEVASMHTTVDRLAREVGRRGLGRIRVPKENFADYGYQLTGGFHHMGTVRMHADPASGVVDENLRAHDVENLYVASSATFTTSGVSNPTLTIVALTLRLADHLADVAKARG